MKNTFKAKILTLLKYYQNTLQNVNNEDEINDIKHFLNLLLSKGNINGIAMSFCGENIFIEAKINDKNELLINITKNERKIKEERKIKISQTVNYSTIIEVNAVSYSLAENYIIGEPSRDSSNENYKDSFSKGRKIFLFGPDGNIDQKYYYDDNFEEKVSNGSTTINNKKTEKLTTFINSDSIISAQCILENNSLAKTYEMSNNLSSLPIDEKKYQEAFHIKVWNDNLLTIFPDILILLGEMPCIKTSSPTQIVLYLDKNLHK